MLFCIRKLKGLTTFLLLSIIFLYHHDATKIGFNVLKTIHFPFSTIPNNFSDEIRVIYLISYIYRQ